MAEVVGIPVFASPLAAAEVIDLLRIYLTKALAPHCTLHGVFMDVLGMGVLIAGESGVGKSELGLELISRGHGLVADDVVEFARVAPDSIEGRCPALLANLLEVRGLGLLDIKAIFGETAVRRRMKLKLIVELRRLAANEVMERLPLAGATEEVLGVPVFKVVIPVAAGRNLAVLLEAAVRNTILKLRGIHGGQVNDEAHVDGRLSGAAAGGRAGRGEEALARPGGAARKNGRLQQAGRRKEAQRGRAQAVHESVPVSRGRSGRQGRAQDDPAGEDGGLQQAGRRQGPQGR